MKAAVCLMQQITADFSIMKVVLDLRAQRPTAVQTKVGAVLEYVDVKLSADLWCCHIIHVISDMEIIQLQKLNTADMLLYSSLL